MYFGAPRYIGRKRLGGGSAPEEQAYLSTQRLRLQANIDSTGQVATKHAFPSDFSLDLTSRPPYGHPPPAVDQPRSAPTRLNRGALPTPTPSRLRAPLARQEAMPRKNKTPALRTRLRDNQRQSRARQRQFVDDLQQRLQAYERQGVQATLEMQRAARAVALDNHHLRALLAQHGVEHGEVERFLRAQQDAPGDPAQGARLGRGPLALLSRQPPLPAEITMGTSGSPCSPSPPQRSSSEFPCFAVATSEIGGVAGIPREEHGADDGDEESGVGLARSDTPLSTATQQTRSNAAPATSSMETLCEAAAAIIAEVQGHNDTGLAFAALGCAGTTGCTVDNLRIFDVIDKTS